MIISSLLTCSYRGQQQQADTDLGEPRVTGVDAQRRAWYCAYYWGESRAFANQTVQQLKANGIPQEAYLAIYCHNDLNKPAHYKSASVELTKAGYTIMLV